MYSLSAKPERIDTYHYKSLCKLTHQSFQHAVIHVAVVIVVSAVIVVTAVTHVFITALVLHSIEEDAQCLGTRVRVELVL